jgi:putative FmdB family regulatory protein
MPTYEYRCQDCKHEFTIVSSISEHDKHKAQCPNCGSQHVEQALSSVSVKTSKKS